ncbi:MAG: hypothetical protein J7L14_03680 [Candidatus Diapherotrites archaeon]|nr:hypothetical protein [Candidatus Diapherotrites archaeon]
MKLRKGDKVKIKADRLMKAYQYLRSRLYTVRNLQKRGAEIYVILDPPLYINIKALEKINSPS